MKKILTLTVLLLFVSLATTQAQSNLSGWFASGEFSLWRATDAERTTFRFKPEVGYNFNEEFALGVKLGIETSSNPSTTYFCLGAFGRYTYLHTKPLSLFVDGGLDYSFADNDGLQIGLTPGLMVHLTDQLAFITSVGFLGYRSGLFGDGFGLDFTSSNLSIGLHYAF